MQTQHDCKSLSEEVPDILGTSDNFLKSQNKKVLDRLLEVASKIKSTLFVLWHFLK